MNPVTHFLVGWEVGCALKLHRRDCDLLVAASLLPDLDGVGLAMDLVAAARQGTDHNLYGAYHHFALHGLPGAVVTVLLVAVFARQKLKVAGWALVVFHLHLLCDLVGSRGPAPADIWPIYYWGPFTREHALAWSGQWPLNGWPNLVISFALLASTLARAARTGVSPTRFLGQRFDSLFVQTLKAWRARLPKSF